MEKTTERESESASAVGVKREHMGHMGLEYMGQDIYLTLTMVSSVALLLALLLSVVPLI